MGIKFIYFDLGKVLLHFTHERGFDQVATVSGLSAEQVRSALFDSGLSERYETGEITTAECHAAYCAATNSSPTLAELTLAWSDIFELNTRMMTIAASLKSAGHRIGILSNTCEAHWEYVARRFVALSAYFYPVITSYEARSMKPDPQIYEIAAKRVGLEPAELLFVDDREENVEGARRLGWNARHYTDSLRFAADLEELGIPFNR